MAEAVRPVEWVSSSKEDLRRFPADVQDHMGFALYQAQVGLKHGDAKPLKGVSPNVLEVVREMDLIRRRLKAAEQHHAETYGKEEISGGG